MSNSIMKETIVEQHAHEILAMETPKDGTAAAPADENKDDRAAILPQDTGHASHDIMRDADLQDPADLPGTSISQADRQGGEVKLTSSESCNQDGDSSTSPVECGSEPENAPAKKDMCTTRGVDVSEIEASQSDKYLMAPVSEPSITSLPIDSLHCIASFLSPGEWILFGQSGKDSRRVCREIFRRVRMHGFRCATEIVTSWVC